MIYYFSGTGNSLYVARQLADAMNDKLSPMTIPASTDDAMIGLVFPVYAWGIPKVVEDFVRKSNRVGSETFLYTVITCGDDVGYADKVLDATLHTAWGRTFDAIFSVQMPNTYVCLPGFDVDSDVVCKAKLAKEQDTIKEIAACISKRKTVCRITRGSFPWTKTYVIRPLFNRYLLTDKYFRVDASRCISCSRCRKSCPMGNILLDEVPVWQSHCVGCLACYHACPYHAINFGNKTQKKGQYNILKHLYV